MARDVLVVVRQSYLHEHVFRTAPLPPPTMSVAVLLEGLDSTRAPHGLLPADEATVFRTVLVRVAFQRTPN